MNTDDLLAQFKREYQDFHRISRERQVRQVRALRDFAQQIAPRPLLETTGRDLTEYMARQLDAGKSPNTVRYQANLIRPFFSWAYAAQLYPVELYMALKSAKDPRGATVQTFPRPYTPAEVRQFFRQLDERYALAPNVNIERRIRSYAAGRAAWSTELYQHGMKLQIEAIVGLALHCGLRRGEIGRLSVDDAHYENTYVVVTGARKNRQAEHVIREVPLTDAARTAIRAWLEFRAIMRPPHNGMWITLHARGGPQTGGRGERTRPMGAARLESLLSGLVAPGWELHRFRHTCATERLRSGMELEALKEFLGHADISQTLAYAKIVKADVYRSVARTDDAFTKRIGRVAA